MDFIVVVHTAEEGGYWVEVPDLPGCFAQGETIDEVLGSARTAIATHIETLRDDGQSVPMPSVIVATVRLPEAARA